MKSEYGKKILDHFPIYRNGVASTLAFNTGFDKAIGQKIFCTYRLCILEYPIIIIMASWQNSSGKENHQLISINTSVQKTVVQEFTV